MADLYHEGNRQLQDRFDTRRLADRIEERINRDTFDADDRAFIESRDMFFLATADEHGPAAVLLQGRRSRVRARGRRADARVPELRRQRHVPVDGEPAPEPAGRDPVHRLHEPEAAAGERGRVDRRAATRCSRRTPRPSSWCGCGPRTSCRTAPGTCTGWSSWSARASCRTRTTRHRFPTGSGGTGRTTCCRTGDPALRGRAAAARLILTSIDMISVCSHRYLSMGGRP